VYGVSAPLYCRSGVAAFGRDPESSHHGKARSVDERIDPLVMASEPTERCAFVLFGHRQDLETGRCRQRVEVVDCGSMPDPPAQEGPRLTSHVVGRDERAPGMLPQHGRRLRVAIVPPVPQRHPETGVDKDHP
jgi:hypothetical protein